MTLGRNIRYLRKQHGWSQEHLANLLGYKNYTSIQKWESGVAEPRFATVQSLAQLFGVDIDTLTHENLELDGAMNMIDSMLKNETRKMLAATNKAFEEKFGITPLNPPTRIPVFSYVSAGSGCFAESNIEEYIDISESLAKRGEHFAVYVKGDSMSPDIKDQDIVVVRKQDYADDGEIVVAVVNGDEGFCKRLVIYDNSVGLVSNNPAYKPMIFSKEEVENLPVRIMGVVVELRRNL